jgi:hypothetical protein
MTGALRTPDSGHTRARRSNTVGVDPLLLLVHVLIPLEPSVETRWFSSSTLTACVPSTCIVLLRIWAL